jgi:DNA sulfur modification protein DndD
MANLKENITRSYSELDDVKRQLVGTSIEEISALERRRTIAQRQLETNLAEQGRLESDLNSIEDQLVDIKKLREAEEKKEKEVALLVRKESLAQRAADAVSRIKEEFFEQTRKEIESSTKEVFSKLAWKQEHFQDVCLDQDFKLEVIDRWGTPTRKELSAGERQILSLSFITAISQLSGEEAPLVMDTPFGRLSGNHLTTVAENLPNLTPQLILFVTDREWDEASKTKLEPRMCAQYDLCFNNKTGCTEIAEICYE